MRQNVNTGRKGKIKMDAIQKQLLEAVAGFHEIPTGAYNIRANGQTAARQSSANIDIITKEDGTGIEIHIKPGTKKESVHIPVVLSQAGLTETVYNDFYIGDDADVTIIAGCGIHNGGSAASQHNGIHRFFIGKNSKVKYIEKHYGEGTGEGKRVMNPVTEVTLEENSFMDMETSQIAGIDDTVRVTNAVLKENASLVVHDKILTSGDQQAKAEINVDLNGENSSCDIISRGVAKEKSYQEVVLGINGNAKCSGHAECDSIIMDKGIIVATPKLKATDVDASLIHEAAIGKIAGAQLIKLMTLGLTEKEAEEEIIQGFLR